MADVLAAVAVFGRDYDHDEGVSRICASGSCAIYHALYAPVPPAPACQARFDKCLRVVRVHGKCPSSVESPGERRLGHGPNHRVDDRRC